MRTGRSVVAVALILALSGCVERRMLIRSNPPGAMVYVDDYPLGLTPISTNFTYYGTRKFRLVKDGYETKTELIAVPPPWHQIPPIDFFSENVVPGKIRDSRVIDFKLDPQLLVPTDQVRENAEQLRRQSRASAVVQPGSLTPPLTISGPGVQLPTPPATAPGPAASPSDLGPYSAPGPSPFPPAAEPNPGTAPSDNALPNSVEPPGGWRSSGQ